MKVAARIFGFLLLGAVAVLTISYFAVDMPAVSSYIHAQSELTAECRDPRVWHALLDFADRTQPFRPDPWHYGPRWKIIRVVTLPFDWSRHIQQSSLGEIVRLFLTSLLVPEGEIAGALCESGLVSIARDVGVVNIGTLSDRDLFALAGVYDASRLYRSPGGDFDLPWLFQQLRALGDENRMAEKYWDLHNQALRSE